MEELNHQAGESFERTRYANRRTYFDQDALGSMDVDLQLSGLVDGRVEQSEQTLVMVQSQQVIEAGAVCKGLSYDKPGE